MEDKEILKISRYLKNGETIDATANKLGLSRLEVLGIINVLRTNGLEIEAYLDHGVQKIYKKTNYKTEKNIKEDIDELEKIELCVVSDTHLGSKCQQLNLLNKTYKEAYKRGIDTFLHCGDMVDGDYRNKRAAHPYELFAQGFDQQAEYIITHYPYIEGATTINIDGSHDQTHFINGGATVGKWVMPQRPDLKYVGNDRYIYKAGSNKNVKIEMYHPGGGSAKSWSYKPQEYINSMESGDKPNMLLMGHFHKSYYMFYRNVHAIETPCFMDKSGFMTKNGLINTLGAYFITLYVNKKGQIEYIIPERYLFDRKDIIKDDYLKTKQLVLKK